MSTDPCVRGLLVTGEQPNIMDFWMPLAGVLNTMVRRDRTTHFTLWNDPPVLDAVVESARRAGVSVQEIVGAGDSERYETLHETPGAGLWRPKVTSKQVECPTCGAQPGEACRGSAYSGRSHRSVQSHRRRVEAAKEISRGT